MLRIPRLAAPAAALVTFLLGCNADSRTGVPLAASATSPSLSRSFGVRSVTGVGTFGEQEAIAFEINDAGELAIVAQTFSDLTFRPIFWSPRSGATELPTLGKSGETRALNNGGMVVGRSQKVDDSSFPLQSHPVAWIIRKGTVRLVEIGPVVDGDALDVSEDGVVVGSYSNTVNGPSTAFRWTERDGLTDIPPIAGNASSAAAINGSGDISGASTIAPGPGPMHAVVWWTKGPPTVIGTFGGNTTAAAINERGEVAGFGRHCAEQTVPCSEEAFYWSKEDGMIPLGKFGGTRSFAFGIDKDGRVIGWYDVSMTERRAFVWHKDEGVFELPSLGGTIAHSGDVNKHGQVSGAASDASGTRQAAFWQLGNVKR